LSRYALQEIDKRISPVVRHNHYEATFEEDPETFIEPKVNIVPLQQLPSPFGSLPELIERKIGTLPLTEEDRIEWRIRIRNQCRDWQQKLAEELSNIVPREPSCIICTEPLNRPVICVNRHACCRICIEVWGRGCPLCKKDQLWQLPAGIALNLPRESIAARLSAAKNVLLRGDSNIITHSEPGFDLPIHPYTMFSPTPQIDIGPSSAFIQ
jgi:hypothetical protein